MSVQNDPRVSRLVADLKTDYRDLQRHDPYIYTSPPTALEASRMLSRAYPAVIHGFDPLRVDAQKQDWSSPSTYEKMLQGEKITIAITDDGMADSVRALEPDGYGERNTFVKPLEEKMSITDFLDRLTKGESSTARIDGADHVDGHEEVVYLQSQDGNIYRSESRHEGWDGPELQGLGEYVERDVEWMKDASGVQAEAVNLWIGSSRSITSIHNDPYENIYHVLSGSKTFTLISPIEGLYLDQQYYPPSTLIRNETGQIQVQPDRHPARAIPWVASSEIPKEVTPLIITVNEGETLYLPAEWWHRVEQNEGHGGLAVALNYWYPSEIHPERYAFSRLARRVARLGGMDGVIPVAGEDEREGEEDQEEEEEVDSDEEVIAAIRRNLATIWGDDTVDQDWIPPNRTA